MSLLHAHTVEAVIGADGTVRVEGVPFPAGTTVRVTILSETPPLTSRATADDLEQSRRIRESLRGTVLRYDDPFSPAVPLEDWNALNPENGGLF